MRYTPDILQRASAAIYLAAPKDVADQIAAMLRQAAEDCRRLEYLTHQFSPLDLNIDGNHTWQWRGGFRLKGANMIAAIDSATHHHTADQESADQASPQPLPKPPSVPS